MAAAAAAGGAVLTTASEIGPVAAVGVVAGSVLLALAGGRMATIVLEWRRQAELATSERERVNGLFQAALEAHSSMGAGDVEAAITRSARVLLGGDDARIDRSPPGDGELGSRLRSAIDPDRWLVVTRRAGASPFAADDERLLEVLVATTGAALDNALLYEETMDERQKLGDVVGSSSDGIFSVDDDGVVTSWNPAMGRITQRPADEAVGRRCEQVFSPLNDDGQPVRADWWTQSTNGGEGSILVIRTRSGERRWLDCAFSPMKEGGVVIVARDISAQREVEELKTDFLATVSHELRTPLTPIQGFLQTLLRDDASFSDEERLRFYEVMLRQSERLERLIKDLLDATSLQDKDHLFFPEEVDWEQTATRVVELFRRQEPGRHFSLMIAEGLPRVIVDEQRAEQVLSNLIANAAKYSPPEEPITVTVELSRGVLVTTVSDRGPGIPETDRDRVFDRFTRLGSHLTRSVGGAGLGLFIARRLVEGMGGRIVVEDAPGGGAAFRFTLPMATAAVPNR
jgi:PAS domain S-box-containing protein